MAEEFDAAKLLKRVHDTDCNHEKRKAMRDILGRLTYDSEDERGYYNYNDTKALLEAGLIETLEMRMVELSRGWAYGAMRQMLCIIKILVEMYNSNSEFFGPDMSFFTPSLLEAILPYIFSEYRVVLVLYAIFADGEIHEHLQPVIPAVREALNSRIEKDPQHCDADYINCVLDKLAQQSGRLTKAARA